MLHWRIGEVSMTRSWEHDRLSREVERTTGQTTEAWFHLMDRARVRPRGVVGALEWLRDQKGMPHRLAATLAWNYFNPSTLPGDIADSVCDRHATPALRLVHGGDGAGGTRTRRTRVRQASVSRAAHTVAGRTPARASKRSSSTTSRGRARTAKPSRIRKK